MVKIAPSILSANFTNLANDVKVMEEGGADWVHFDVMDGHFVPTLTFGPVVLKAIKAITDLPLDVHLMCDNPSHWFDSFIDLGASSITFHVEAEPHLQRMLDYIRKRSVKAGLVLNPSTSLSTLEYSLEYCDLIMLMTVNPGFPAQQFIPEMYGKIEALRKMIDKGGYNIELELDGGINEDTAKRAIDAGATVLVAGNAIFASDDPIQAIQKLRCSK